MSGYFTNTVMKSSGKLQLIYLLSALAALQLIIAFCTNTLMFTHEEAMWHYIGRNWFRHGLIPYAGGVDNKSPLIFSFFGVSDWLFGVNYWFPRILGILVQSTGIFFLYQIVVIRSGKQAGLMAAVIYGLSLTWHATGGKYVSFTETYSITCVLVCIYFILKQNGKSNDFVAGLFSGFGLWFRIASVFSIPLVYIYLIRHRKQGIFYFTLGLVLAVSFIAIIFSLAGVAVSEYWFYGFTDNFGTGSPTDHTLSWKMQAFSGAFFFSELVLFYPFVMIYCFISKRIDFVTAWLICEFAGIMLIGIYASNHFKVLLPSMSFMAAYSLKYLGEKNQWSSRKTLAGLCILFLPKTFEPLWGIRKFFSEPVCETVAMCSDPSLRTEYAKKILGLWIKENTKPADKVFISGMGAQVQVYSERVSPSIYFNATKTEYAEYRVMKDLNTNKPAMILLPAFHGNMSSKVQSFLDNLTEKYDYKGCRYGYQVFINKI